MFCRNRRQSVSPRAKGRRVRMFVRALEDRAVPATFTVIDPTDLSGVVTGTGAGLSGDLRFCIDQANDEVNHPGADTIVFDPVVFASATTITLDPILGAYTATSPMTITGTGQSKLVLDGNMLSDLFVAALDNVDSVTLTDMTLTKGAVTGTNTAAGVFTYQAFLTLTNVTISNCTGQNGAVALAGSDATAGKIGTITATNVTFSNIASTPTLGAGQVHLLGGAVFIAGNETATFTNCKWINCTAIATGGAASAGALMVRGSASVTVDGSTVTGCATNGPGGAFANDGDGTLTVQNSTITGCSVSTSHGGAFSVGYGFTGTLNINNSTISNCKATNGGGFLSSATGTGTINISKSTIDGSESSAGGAILFFANASMNVNIDSSTFSKGLANNGPGGFILCAGNFAGTLSITNSTISGNTASGSGGAFYMLPYAGIVPILNVRNSTIQGNSSGNNGGAMRLTGTAAPGFGGLATFTNCTIVGNTAAGNGGAVAATGAAGSTNFVSSILAQNKAGVANTTDVFSSAVAVTTIDFSLVGVNPSPLNYTVPTAGSNKTGTTAAPLNPQLLPLAFYGGVTKTMVPMAGSPVIDAGKTPALDATDQRGAGFPRNFGAASLPDIGATEANNPSPFVSDFGGTNVTVAGGLSTQFSITFDDDNGLNVSTLSAAGAVTVSGPGFATPATATFVDTNPSGQPNGKPRTAIFQVAAPAGGWSFANNGIYTVTVNGGKIFDTDAPNPLSVASVTAGTFKVGIGTTLLVNQTGDLGVGSGTSGDIRFVLGLANSAAFAGADTINFDTTVFASDTTITLSKGEIGISDGVTINGPVGVAVSLFVSAAPNRHLSISGAGNVININNLVFINGAMTGNPFSGYDGGSISISGATVNLSHDTFSMNGSRLNGGAIASNNGLLTIDTCDFSLNFNEAGSGSAGGAVSASGSNGSLTILNSTFSMNSAQDGGAGAVIASGLMSVTVAGSTFDGNIASGTGFTGGAMVLANCQTVSISGTTFKNNSLSDGVAINGGGALALSGASTVTIDRCTFDGNTVANGDGGAIFTQANGGIVPTLTITNSTFSNNQANGNGGAIALSAGGALTMQNCTLAYNVAALDGGAIFINATTMAATIQNTTVAFNFAGGGALGGGGIAMKAVGAGGSLTLASSIVSNNTNALANDVAADVALSVAGNNNLIGAADVGNITYSGTGNLVGTAALPLDAMLDPTLALNGAPTGSPLTLAITAASPAHDKGNNTAGLTTDQRGTGFFRSSGAGTDIGAFEIQEATPARVVSVLLNGTEFSTPGQQHSRVKTLQINFDHPVSLVGSINDAFTLKRVADNAVVSFNATLDASGLFVTFTFNLGSATDGVAGNVSLADGRYVLTAVASQFANGLDGDGNGTPGDNYVSPTAANSPPGTPPTGIFRLFGDIDGNGQINGADFLQFRLNFLQAFDAFDIDGNGQVNGADFLQFRLHFLQSIT